MRLKKFVVNIALPIGPGISGTWEPDKNEQEAAWEMYIELVTRVTVVPLKPGEGLLREALSSYYSLFETTRKILREHGYTVAQPKGPKGHNSDRLSFGIIAVAILNDMLRPLLSKWHPRLQHHETQCPSDRSKMEHEELWSEATNLREEIEQARKILKLYADLLAQIANIPSLTR